MNYFLFLGDYGTVRTSVRVRAHNELSLAQGQHNTQGAKLRQTFDEHIMQSGRERVRVTPITNQQVGRSEGQDLKYVSMATH